MRSQRDGKFAGKCTVFVVMEGGTYDVREKDPGRGGRSLSLEKLEFSMGVEASLRETAASSVRAMENVSYYGGRNNLTQIL